LSVDVLFKFIGGGKIAEPRYDLEMRLLEYAAMIVRLVENLPKTRAGNHIAGQLLRSGTSPLPNHGEAEAAESRNDFTHKLGICHKELRESRRWLRLIKHVPLLGDNAVELAKAIQETDELVRIFAASIRTARGKTKQSLDSRRT
jgi:four helix bundle protein